MSAMDELLFVIGLILAALLIGGLALAFFLLTGAPL